MTASTQQLHAAADLTLGIEQAMREADFWHTSVPSPAAMASRTPFCADTLIFTQWLQFVFLPRMRELIGKGETLPVTSGIAAMAEEALADQPGKPALVARLRAFDELIESGVN